jgi:putative addiction module component (TIGR02574 family)
LKKRTPSEDGYGGENPVNTKLAALSNQV